LREDLLRFESGEEAQFAEFSGAATVSHWAAALTDDVRHLDQILYIGINGLRSAASDGRLLVPPSEGLLEVLAFISWTHLERFDYRLELSDLSEAERYASQVIELPDARPPMAAEVIARRVNAEAAIYRTSLDGASGRIRAHLGPLRKLVEEEPDALLMGTLAAALRTAIDVADPDDGAGADLNEAASLLAELIHPETAPPPIPVSHLLRARWTGELAAVHHTAFQLWDEQGELERAEALAALARESAPESASAALVAASISPSADAYLDARELSKRRRRTLTFLGAAEGLTWYLLKEGDARVGQAGAAALSHLHKAVERQVTDADTRLFLQRIAALTAVVVPATRDVRAAADHVERARARLLAERFPDDETELRRLERDHPELAEQVRRALRTLRDRTRSSMARINARDDLMWWQAKVRELPDYADFRRSVPLRGIEQSLNAPLVFLVPGIPTGVALLVFQDAAPVAVPLPECVVNPVPLPVRRFQSAVFDSHLPAGARRAAVDSIADWTWGAVYEPIRNCLRGYGKAHVVGSSYLGVTPLHAARRPDSHSYALHDVELRYIPSVGALKTLQERLVPPRPARVLLVPQPAGAGAPLDGASMEITHVANEVPDALRLDPAEVNARSLTRGIGEVGWLHVASHAFTDAADPFASGLRLSGTDRFTLRELANVDHGHLLGAILSACKTNVPDPDLPDETLSLASGLLFGGCRAVIASSWEVPDPATAELMRRYYTIWQPNTSSMASALRDAQLTFANGDESENWRPEWREPYYWAGFSYVGP
jgi:hypothetical protein